MRPGAPCAVIFLAAALTQANAAEGGSLRSIEAAYEAAQRQSDRLAEELARLRRAAADLERQIESVPGHTMLARERRARLGRELERVRAQAAEVGQRLVEAQVALERARTQLLSAYRELVAQNRATPEVRSRLEQLESEGHRESAVQRIAAYRQLERRLRREARRLAQRVRRIERRSGIELEMGRAERLEAVFAEEERLLALTRTALVTSATAPPGTARGEGYGAASPNSPPSAAGGAVPDGDVAEAGAAAPTVATDTTPAATGVTTVVHAERSLVVDGDGVARGLASSAGAGDDVARLRALRDELLRRADEVAKRRRELELDLARARRRVR